MNRLGEAKAALNSWLFARDKPLLFLETKNRRAWAKEKKLKKKTGKHTILKQRQRRTPCATLRATGYWDTTTHKLLRKHDAPRQLFLRCVGSGRHQERRPQQRKRERGRLEAPLRDSNQSNLVAPVTTAVAAHDRGPGVRGEPPDVTARRRGLVRVSPPREEEEAVDPREDERNLEWAQRSPRQVMSHGDRRTHRNCEDAHGDGKLVERVREPVQGKALADVLPGGREEAGAGGELD